MAVRWPVAVVMTWRTRTVKITDVGVRPRIWPATTRPVPAGTAPGEPAAGVAAARVRAPVSWLVAIGASRASHTLGGSPGRWVS